MERNHNEQQIVMSIEHYNNLLGMADRGQYTTSKIERHVRKFNPFLQAPHQAKVKAFESRRSERIRQVRGIVEKHHGQIVYGRTHVPHFDSEEQGEIYTPVEVKCINRENRALVVIYKGTDRDRQGNRWRSDRQTITADTIVTNIPEGYIQLVGPTSYSTLYVKEYSPLHYLHLNTLAQRENDERDAYKERVAKNAEQKIRAGAVMYDAIGEK